MEKEDIYLDSIAFQLSKEVTEPEITDIMEHSKQYAEPVEVLKMIDNYLGQFFINRSKKISVKDREMAVNRIKLILKKQNEVKTKTPIALQYQLELRLLKTDPLKQVYPPAEVYFLRA